MVSAEEIQLVALVLAENARITLYGHWSPEAPATQRAGLSTDGQYWTNNKPFNTALECARYLCRNLSSVESYK